MSLGELKKMKIIGYTDITFKKKTGQEYEVIVNPENYSISYETIINGNDAQGSSLPLLQYNQQSSQILSFKFLFDGTGVLKKGNMAGVAVPGLPSKKPDVVKEIDDFKKAVYDFRSDNHQPPFVQLQWGPLLFNCVLTKMDISFKLFRPDGWPLRAEAQCTFRSAIDKNKMEEIKNKKLAKNILTVALVREPEDEKRLAKIGIGLQLDTSIADCYRPPLDVLIGQLFGLFASIELGLKPDAPSPSGAISRVVSKVNIY